MKMIVAEIGAPFLCCLSPLNYFRMSNELQELLSHITGHLFILMQNEYTQGAECYHYKNIHTIFKIFIVLLSEHVTVSGRETEAQREDPPNCSKSPSKYLLEAGNEPRFLKSSFRICFSSSVNEHRGHYAVKYKTPDADRIGYLY